MAAHRPWSHEDVPGLSGRTAIVTGANSGIGLEAARALAHHGAHVILACRNLEKGRAAEADIRGGSPEAKISIEALDLASLASIRAFAERVLASRPMVDLLVNNAGVMAMPYRRTTDGFEMQLGTNHLGHFALTGLLLERILQTSGTRVVTVSSTAHRYGRIDFDDLQSERHYGPWRAYAQSKLANLLFAFELQRRLASAGADAISVACHPGYAATQLQEVGPRLRNARLMSWAVVIGNRLFAQDARMGALPTLYAATAPDVRGGDFIGPGGLAEMRGHPRRARASTRAHDVALATKLWEVSERLTGVRYDALA
jgi:NAD(P)-dependent dehydrogenase (short-subunit alcohol dehydrogenase family)